MRPTIHSTRATVRLAGLAIAALLIAPHGASAVSFSIGFEGGNTTTIDSAAGLGCVSAGEEGQLSCDGSGTPGLIGNESRGWVIDSLGLFLDPDPTVSNAIAVTNNTLSTQTFVVSVVLPVSVTFGPPSFITGSVGISVTDNNGNGATAAAAANGSVYTGLIDGTSVATLLNDPFSLAAGNFGSNTASANLGGPFAIAVATGSDIGLTLRFTLTPGDSASLTSVFNVEPIPEPGTAILLTAGLIGLARMGRPRA